jgi:transcriptional regulator with XRE-family HTH domain
MGTREFEHYLLLEHMRATARYAVFTCGHAQADLASRIGISRSTLKRLLDGGELGYPSWGKVLVWCEAYGMQHVHAEQAALSLLVAHYPVRERQRAREHAVRWMKHKLISTSHRLPEWIVGSSAWRRADYCLRCFELGKKTGFRVLGTG